MGHGHHSYSEDECEDAEDDVRVRAAQGRLRVLLVDDLPQLASAYARHMRWRGWRVECLQDPSAIDQRITTFDPDVILLDRDFGIGRANEGLRICERLRARGDCPILIILSAHAELEQRTESATAGADAHIGKAANDAQEVITRVEEVVITSAERRSNPWLLRARILTVAELCVHLEAESVLVSGRPVHLARSERELLLCLCRHVGRAVGARELCRAAGIQVDREFRNLNNSIRRLRKRLGISDPRTIETVRGVGYRLEGG